MPSPDAETLGRSTYEKVLGKSSSKPLTAVRELSITHLFAHVWNRPHLSMRDRSLITIALLAAQGRLDQLRDHIRGALHRGMTRDEILETMVQVAHYAGWPAGISGQIVAEETFAE
jgi:4-carboxymuconolactone decarboxylase